MHWVCLFLNVMTIDPVMLQLWWWVVNSLRSIMASPRNSSHKPIVSNQIHYEKNLGSMIISCINIYDVNPRQGYISPEILEDVQQLWGVTPPTFQESN